MGSTGFSLLAAVLVLLKIHISQGASLSPYGRNVQTTYEHYYVPVGTSIYTYYYVRTCSRTCAAHFAFCWKYKWVCRNQRRSYWRTYYKNVRRTRPIYRCKYGWKQSGSSCSTARCYGCYGHGYCYRPWTCSCYSGWTGSRCRSDINECSQSWRNSCSYKAGCINTPGSYRCTCASGFRLSANRRTCYDINECRSSHGCKYPASCQNTQGSYRCTCKRGYSLDSNQTTCKDVDECTSYQNDCSYKAGCQNTIGGYSCSCLPGYYLVDGKKCQDVNECDNSDCQQNCINYPGGYNCSCYTGYRANTTDYKLCQDIDECSKKLAGCSQICNNTIGGFSCSCNEGYHLSWDKKFCNDIDECKSNEHGCQHTCENTLGSYNCQCRPGYESFSHGKNCTGKPCLPIYTPVNGRKSCSGYTTEHTCSFSCSIGYRQVGSYTRTCIATKRWSGKAAKCKPIHCPKPPNPTNGFIYSPCNTRFNSECLGGCNEGFYTNETSKLKCSVNGTWEHAQISCNAITVCEPNPCSHGGKCTVLTSDQFSCDCSNTGYEGTKCEIGVIDIPDYPPLIAGVPVESVEFRASPPDNYVILTPQGVGIEFNPPYLFFQRNATMAQSLTMTARHPGLHYVRYYLSGPSAAGYQAPQPNAFFVEAVKNSVRNISTAYDNIEFPHGCYKLELGKCAHSNVTITAYSTSSWLMFGPTATSNGQVSLGNGNFQLPHSMTGYSFNPKRSSSLDNDCETNSTKTYPSVELIKHRILTKSFLKVLKNSLPKWLDVRLRGNVSSTSLVVTDLQAFYLTGRDLRKEAFIEGQLLSDDTYFSLLLSPDIDLIVNGDRVSFGLNDRNARFSLALELCGTPPNNVILQPSPDNFNVINQLSIIKQLRHVGWNFKIFSFQVGKSSIKKSLTMVAKFSKNFAVSRFVKSRLDFRGTILLYFDTLDKLMDFPLDRKWDVELYGDTKLNMEFKVQGKITKLSINMLQVRSYATFGGVNQEQCSPRIKENFNGLLLTQIMEENPFAHTELSNFVEMDYTRYMSFFLSTILYTERQSNVSRYREVSDGVIMNFHGHLKFAALRFDSLNIKFRIRSLRCSLEMEQNPRIVAELSGSYAETDSNKRKLGIFALLPDSVVNLHIGHERNAASGGFFKAIVNVLGFQNRVNVNISQDSLMFYAKGKLHGVFDATAIFKSDLTNWRDQRYTAAGDFETTGSNNNIDSLLEEELKNYSTELLRKLQTRLDLSVQTKERAKSRLTDVKILREKSAVKIAKVAKEYGRVNSSLDLAKKRFDHLLRLAEEYSDEIEQLKQELDELCELQQCPRICQEGRMCETCWEYVTAKKTGKCPATCHQTEQKRIPPLTQGAICLKERCKRIHTVHSFFGDLLGLAVGIGGMFVGLPPTVSFSIGRKVQQFAISVKKGDPDFNILLEAATEVVPGSKVAINLAKASARVVKGDNLLSIIKDSPFLKNHISNTVRKIKLLKTSEIFSVTKKISTFTKGTRLFVEEQISSFRKEAITPIMNEVERLKKIRKVRLLLPRRKRQIPLPAPIKKLLSSIRNKVMSLLQKKISSFTSFILQHVNKKVASLDEMILPSLSRINGELPSLSRINGELPSLSRINGELPSLSRINGELPSLSRINGELQSFRALESRIKALKSRIKNLKREAYAIVKQRISSFKNMIRSELEKLLSSLKEDAVSSLMDILKDLPAGFGKAANIAGDVLGVAGGVMSLVGKSQGRWECEFKEEKCTKGRFEYKYIDHPYTCDLPCEKRYVKETIQKSCCSTVTCASLHANVSCITRNTLCKTARKKALGKISKVKANAASILGRLDNASQNLSYWKMKKEIMLSKARSASRAMDAYQDAESSLEKAFNVTVENQKRIWKILAKPLKNLLNEQGEPLIEIKGIKFKVTVLPELNATLLPVNITMMLNGTQKKQLSTVLDFTNLNRSVRSIAKEILAVFVGDVSRFSRRKRSAESKNVSTDDSKFYTLQTFHRLCSEFLNHKQTLYEAAVSLYNLSSENRDLLEEEKQRKMSLTSNKSAIFEKFKINKTKASELDVVVNYDSYSNALANDPELREAKRFEIEALENEFDVVHSSSKLLYKNWLATMENIFVKFSDECSGFDDCLKYTIDSLFEIVFETNVLKAERLMGKIKYVEEMFINLTRQSDVSVHDAVTISWNILQALKNITGVETVCAQAPNMTEHPMSFIELGVNKTLVLTCNATGDSLVYQWKFNGNILKNQSRSILQINDVSPLHSGNYSCEVSNHVAKASSIPAVVVIGTPPLIVHHPLRRLNVVVSGYGTLICQVKRGTANISYQWWFSSFDSGSFMPLPNETFSHLSFAPVTSHQEGWYFCNVSNPFGHSISRKSFLKVLKYTLPVPVAKLSLTVVSQSPENTSVFYKDELARILASRLVTSDNNTQSSKKLIEELNPTICKQISQGANGFDRTETCDWTFSVIGENVSSSIFNSTPSQQINEIIRSTFRLKRVIGGLGNDTNAAKIKFSLDSSNFSSPENSLGIMKISLICPKGQVFLEDVYKCADCPPGSYGTMAHGVATCSRCPRGFYQSIPGQISCNKCPEEFVTAYNGAYDQRQCEDENKFFIVFLLVNKYHGDVLVTANMSGKLEIFDLKPTSRMVKSKKWKTERLLILSAIDPSTNDTVKINGQSSIRLQPTTRERISLRVLNIQAQKAVRQLNTKRNSAMTPPLTNAASNTPLPINVLTDKVVSTQTSPVAPSTNEFENFKDPLNATEDENKFHFVFLMVNNYHATVLVTTHVSNELESFYLNATNSVVISKKMKTERPMMLSAVDARTNQTVEINGQSIVRQQPRTKESISLTVLLIATQTDPSTTKDENLDNSFIVTEEGAQDVIDHGALTSSE